MDKMREEFEEWYSIAVGTPRPAIRLLRCGDQYLGEDSCGLMNMFFEVWQASRSSLRVELPDNLDGEYYADGWNACLIAVGEKIEEAGVSCK